MKVLIDGNTLGNNRAGIGNYTYCLLQEIGRLCPEDISISVAIRKKVWHTIPGELNFKGIAMIRSGERSFAKYLPFATPDYRGHDLYHEPNYVPRAFSGKTVITIHDMSHRLFPQYHPWKRVLKLKYYERTMRRATKIITVSQNSKNEILDILKVPEEKVAVIYEGALDIYRPLKLSEPLTGEVRELYKLPEQFILYVGTIEPRKNLARLIEAFWMYKQQRKSSGVKLVLAGGKGWLYENIFNRVRELKMEKDVHFTGYVNDEHLPLLYNMALAFVYPSIYEGFGLPPLEAMSCGTPVITSNTSSLPEVVGDAGIRVNPHQTEQLAEAIHKVLDTEAVRAELSQRALLQAAKFSWEKCARETLQIYRECLTN
ncbi:glycosyltransferase family 4 protein [Desulfotomaculum sp. 1211_IL3151]|uniref:glycosyltransferase family 4 protein n=1 Tax=Desulfotomaculum sp. 1211_IL3151 TaxID=3084055 RepID=UPI002FD92092